MITHTAPGTAWLGEELPATHLLVEMSQRVMFGSLTPKSSKIDWNFGIT